MPGDRAGQVGYTHTLPTPFLQHLPPWTPAAEAVVAVTGIIEIALGGALLLRQPWRYRTGLALAAYLIAVFPGNVYVAVAVADVDVDGQPGGWYPWLRLPLQALFIAWAVWSTREPAAADVGQPAARRVEAGHQRRGCRKRTVGSARCRVDWAKP